MFLNDDWFIHGKKLRHASLWDSTWKSENCLICISDNQLLILGGGGAFSYRPVVQTAFCIYLCYLCIILYISLVIWNMCDQLRDFSRHCTIQNTVVEVRSKCPNIGIMLHMTCIFAWYADWVKYVFYTNTYIRYSGFKCISFCTHSNVLPMMVEDTSPIITVFKI